MNNDSQFENRLRRQPPREVPASWREEILAAAKAAAPSHLSPAIRSASWWRELFWPCPQAWAALAAVWLVILGTHFATSESLPKSLARQPASPSPQMRELLKQQGQLFAELMGPMERLETDRPKPVTPQPRSQRREEFQSA